MKFHKKVVDLNEEMLKKRFSRIG